jgi:hypothetical protein
MLREVDYYWRSDVSGQPMGPKLQGQAIQEDCFSM